MSVSDSGTECSRKHEQKEIPLHHFLLRRRSFPVCILLRLVLFWSGLILACEAPNLVCVLYRGRNAKTYFLLFIYFWILVSNELSKLYCAGFLFNNRNYQSTDCLVEAQYFHGRSCFQIMSPLPWKNVSQMAMSFYLSNDQTNIQLSSY